MSPLEHPYRGPQAGRRERKMEAPQPQPPLRFLHVVVAAGMVTGAGPTAKCVLRASHGLAGGGRRSSLLGPPCHLQQHSSAVALGCPLLQTQRLCTGQPNPQHVAARSRFVDKAKCGMASLYLSTPKGQTVAFTLRANAASAFITSIFNLLVSREQLLQ